MVPGAMIAVVAVLRFADPGDFAGDGADAING